MIGMNTMSKQADDKYKELTYDRIVEVNGQKIVETITETTKNYQSRRDASSKYHEKLDTIAVRVPKGKSDIVKQYVKENSATHPEWIVKGKPSVNAFVKSLIEDAIGQSLD